MLTPAKIKNHHFDASGRNAYKAESVDAFFNEVAESYEQMFRENGEMYKKINLLAERLEEYKNDEDNIRNALVMANRMAEKIRSEAEEKANALISDAETRAKTENDRIDAVSNDLIQKASYKAKAIIDDAQMQADKLISDATYESKAAAVSARDSMIKEEATLELMKAEVTKFKKQILDAYSEQLALIEQLPEIVLAKIEEAKQAESAEESEEESEEIVAEETVEEPAEESSEESFEEPVEETAVLEFKEEEDSEPAEEFEEKTEQEEVTVVLKDGSEEDDGEPAWDEITEEAEAAEEDIEEPSDDEAEENWFAHEKKEDNIDVEQLQQLIEETEEKSGEYDEEDDEPEEEFSSDVSEIIPEIEDDAEELERIKEEIDESTTPDIMISKNKNGENKGFSVNFENITSYVDPVDDGDNVVDDFDEGNGGGQGGFASKFKGFFKK